MPGRSSTRGMSGQAGGAVPSRASHHWTGTIRSQLKGSSIEGFSELGDNNDSVGEPLEGDSLFAASFV